MKDFFRLLIVLPIVLISCTVENPNGDLIHYSELPKIPVDLIIEAGESETYFPARLNELYVTSDGSIIASDHGSTTLEQFTPDGQHIKTIATEGGGPGELSTFFFIADAGDDRLMIEHRDTRRDFFEPNEDGIYVYKSTISSDEGSQFGYSVLGYRPGDEYYASPRNVIRNPRELLANPVDYRTQTVAIVNSESKTIQDSLHILRTPYPHFTEVGNGGFRIDIIPYRNIDRFIPMQNGEYLIARPGQSTLSFFDIDHNLKKEIELSVAPRPVERSDLDYAFRNTRTDVRRGIEPRVDSQKPPFLDLWASENFLLLHIDNREEEKEFVVLDLDGNPEGKFLLSEYDDVKRVIENRIYSIHKDPDVGDSIRVYEVREQY